MLRTYSYIALVIKDLVKLRNFMKIDNLEVVYREYMNKEIRFLYRFIMEKSCI